MADKGKIHIIGAAADVERQMREATEKLRVKAKLAVNVAIAPPYGQIFIEGKGPLDIDTTVIAVPIPAMLEYLAVYLTGQIAPMLAQMPVMPLSQSALDDSGKN